MTYCKEQKECEIKMPEEVNKKLSFNGWCFKSRLPYIACADFEAMNVPIQSATPDARKSYQNKLTNQR